MVQTVSQTTSADYAIVLVYGHELVNKGLLINMPEIKVFVCLASREVHFEITVGVMTPSMRSQQGKR